VTINILIADDDQVLRWTLKERLNREGYDVQEASSAAHARRVLETRGVDIMLMGLDLPDAQGLDLLRFALAEQPDIAAIMLTAHSSVDTAVAAIKEGAFDYLSKPIDLDRLISAVHRALEHRAVQTAHAEAADQKRRRFGLSSVIGSSATFAEVKEMARKVAASGTTSVLLLGETGVGKDVFARAIHYESPRVEEPFMNITCTAMPETLIESELFGYEEGAFTNATGRKSGLFELAHNGSVFLDEIGDMPHNLQSKLLRVLEEKSFRRIGGTKDIRVDCRVIAATNRDLAQLIDEGKFREDLYYRLSTVPITVPALRDRAGDVPLLAGYFLDVYRQKLGRTIVGFSPETMRKLQEYQWPGNVRELRNAVERAVLLCPGEVIEEGDIVLGRREPAGKTKGSAGALLPTEGCNLADVERSLVLQALERTRGNQTRAAELLGITRDQVRYKMEKYGVA
jgi:DNA-binding NtrC family response regulator